MSNDDEKILQLLNSGNAKNIELAFQLCAVTIKNYGEKVAKALQKHKLLCVKYEVERDYYQNLETLIIRYEEHTKLPAALSQLSNLTHLDMKENFLVEVSDVTTLILSYNQLTHLPPEIGKLQNLRSLHLAENHLQDLPVELTQLENLATLYLHNNPMDIVVKRAIRAALPHCEVFFEGAYPW